MTMPSIGGRTAQGFMPGMPRVDLTPPEYGEASRFRRFQFAMGATLLGAVVVVAALTVQAHHGVTAAQRQLTAANTQHSTLLAQRANLQPVQDIYAQVASKQALLAQAMGQEVRWSYYLEDLSLKIPTNVWLSNVAATETTAGAPSSAATTGIGSITFTGIAFSHDDVATWLDVLSNEKGYTSPYFSNSTESFIGPRRVVNFSSSVVLTNAAESGRYSSASGS
jgi:Tfp pilus assembly protein PilN